MPWATNGSLPWPAITWPSDTSKVPITRWLMLWAGSRPGLIQTPVTELLNHAKASAPARAETDEIRIIEEEERADQEVILRTIQLARQDKKFRNLRTKDWHQAQLMDPVIPHVLDWLCLPRNNQVKLKDFLQGKASEADCRAYGLREKEFEKRDHLLFIKTTPPGNVGTILVFRHSSKQKAGSHWHVSPECRTPR